MTPIVSEPSARLLSSLHPVLSLLFWLLVVSCAFRRAMFVNIFQAIWKLVSISKIRIPQSNDLGKNLPMVVNSKSADLDILSSTAYTTVESCSTCYLLVLALS